MVGESDVGVGHVDQVDAADFSGAAARLGADITTDANPAKIADADKNAIHCGTGHKGRDHGDLLVEKA